MFRTIVTSFFCFSFLVSGCADRDNTGAAKGDSLSPVATVNQQAITQNQLQARFDSLRDERSLTPDGALSLRAAALRVLIDEALVAQAAESQGVNISQKALDAAVADFAAGFPEEAAYLTFLNNTLGGEQALRQRLRHRLLLERLALPDQAKSMSDEAVETYYRENADRYQSPGYLAVRGLLVAVPKHTGAEQRRDAREQAEKIHRRVLESKTDFAAAAKAQSTHNSAADGGDLGRVTPSTYPIIYQALMDLSPGAVAPILATEQGYWIVQLVARVPPRRASLQEAADEIRRTLALRQRSANVTVLLRDLRSQAEISSSIDIAQAVAAADRRKGGRLLQTVPQQGTPEAAAALGGATQPEEGGK